MVRTKNTAKKSNGGSAPRVILNFPRASGASGVERQRREALTSSKASTVGGGDVEKRNARHKVRLSLVSFFCLLTLPFFLIRL
jgi:hypothetical protein